MPTVPRIVAVDTQDTIASIVRGAMTLLDRRYILVEVPSAENALEELQNNDVNLLVTAYTLPDSTGLELAARAIRESAMTKIIVLANSHDPEVDAQALVNAPYQYFVRPVGEPFLRALRIGLDGEAAVMVQETATTSSNNLELGPIPELNTKAIQDGLFPLMRETQAIGAIVCDRLGRIVFSEGYTEEFDKDALAAWLSPAFARTADIRDLIGSHAWSLQYYDGGNHDVAAMSLGLHYFVVLIFEGNAPFGPLTRYGREEANKIIDKLGEEAWAFRRAVVTQSMPALKPSDLESFMAQEDAAIAPSTTVDVAPSTVAIPTPASAPELVLEPVDNLDVDKLFGQSIDESQFDDLFSDGGASTDPAFLSSDNMVSFDEALNMGILDE